MSTKLNGMPRLIHELSVFSRRFPPCLLRVLSHYGYYGL
jgi:hypothetical protein